MLIFYLFFGGGGGGVHWRLNKFPVISNLPLQGCKTFYSLQTEAQCIFLFKDNKWTIPFPRRLNFVFTILNDYPSIFPQPFQMEVATYQPTIEDLNKVGNGLDVLLRELQVPLSTKPHYRSNQLSATMSREEMERREIQDKMDKSIIQPEAPGQSRVNLILW